MVICAVMYSMLLYICVCARIWVWLCIVFWFVFT